MTKENVEKKVPAMRQIIIETDGKSVNLAKAEVYGPIEMVAILNMVINFVQNQGSASNEAGIPEGTKAEEAAPEEKTKKTK